MKAKKKVWKINHPVRRLSSFDMHKAICFGWYYWINCDNLKSLYAHLHAHRLSSIHHIYEIIYQILIVLQRNETKVAQIQEKHNTHSCKNMQEKQNWAAKQHKCILMWNCTHTCEGLCMYERERLHAMLFKSWSILLL